MRPSSSQRPHRLLVSKEDQRIDASHLESLGMDLGLEQSSKMMISPSP